MVVQLYVMLNCHCLKSLLVWWVLMVPGVNVIKMLASQIMQTDGEIVFIIADNVTAKMLVGYVPNSEMFDYLTGVKCWSISHIRGVTD